MEGVYRSKTLNLHESRPVSELPGSQPLGSERFTELGAGVLLSSAVQGRSPEARPRTGQAGPGAAEQTRATGLRSRLPVAADPQQCREGPP